MVAFTSEAEEAVEHVRLRPVEARIALTRRVLETLDSDSSTSTPGFKGPPAQQVLGL